MMKLKNNDSKGASGNKLLGPAFVYIALTCFAGFLLASVWHYFVANPTVTSLESSVFPVNNIPFPGVALCSANKISKRQAANLADFIVNKTGDDREKVMEHVKFLGFLFDADYDDYNEEFEEFQGVLDKLELDIRTLMRSLTTPCDEFLNYCSWQGIKVDCSSIFYMRQTYEGYCCTFNYVKNTTDWWERFHSLENLTLQVGIHGINSGLSVTINNDLDDYYYTTLSTTGIKILIFNPTDYPDKASGDLVESIVDVGTENFLQINPTTVAAVADVMHYGVEKRNCRFEVEQQTQFGVYSQSDCFVDCRVRSVLALCGCIPFMIPLGSGDDICTLTDLSCLSKYQTKWISHFPDGVSRQLLLKEQEDGLFCPDICYPACEDFSYQVVPSSAPLFKQSNRTYVHIYYPNRFLNLFRQDVVHYWFDILSSVGGIFGMILGFSILSVIEGIIYCVKFVAARW